VDKTFGRADSSLANVNEHLEKARSRLRQTQTELAAIQKREADLAAKPPAERNSRRLLSKKSVESVNPKLSETRELLVQATEAALVVNGVLEALAELPFVERLSNDTDRLKNTSSQPSEGIERSNKLANLLAKAGPSGDSEIGGESTRIRDTLDRVVSSLDGADDRIEKTRGKVEESHSRIKYWIRVAGMIVTAVLVWIGLGQLSLLIHGGKLVRRP